MNTIVSDNNIASYIKRNKLLFDSEMGKVMYLRVDGMVVGELDGRSRFAHRIVLLYWN